MEEQKIAELLSKFNSGTATEQELTQLEKVADNLLNTSKANVFESDIEKHKIKKELKSRISVPKEKSRFSWGKIAASVTIILGLAVGYYTTQNQLFGPEMIVVNTGFGEQKSITLPDGTTVLLNSKSTLSYPAQFSDISRHVTIEGEGLFSVTKNPNKPFSVAANALKTTVLGTEFNVNAYPNDSLVCVSLLEGAVRIEQEENNMLLSPNEQVIFKLSDQTISKSEFDASIITAWKENTIVFKNTEFDKVKNIIEREYGVSIEFKQSEIKQYKISGTFKDPELNTLLATICAVKSLEFKNTESNKVIISKKQPIQ